MVRAACGPIRVTYTQRVCRPICVNMTHWHPPHRTPRCEVCDSSVRPTVRMDGDDADARLCGQLDCKFARRMAERMPPQQRTTYLAMQKNNILERRKQRRAENLRRKAIWRFEERQCRAAEAHVERRFPEFRNTPRQSLVIPWLTRTERKTAPKQREEYLEHLRVIAEEAERLDSADSAELEHPDSSDGPKTASEERLEQVAGLRAQCDALCASCQGGCCTLGGQNGAYLTVKTARELLDRHPEWGSADLVDTWASYLPDKSIERSCPNQTHTGCALPRELRSRTCNGFYCDALKKLQDDAVDRGGVMPVIALQNGGDLWGRFDKNRDRTIRRLVLVEGGKPTTLDADGMNFPLWKDAGKVQ